MDNSITISEEIVDSVIRPISLFLNDVKVGASFTHIALKPGEEYSMEKPVFKYACDKGGLFKFSIYDVQKFKNNDGVSFGEYFVPQIGADCLIRREFKVTKCEPYKGHDGNKVYPQFCYKGFELYLAEKAKHADADEPVPQEVYTDLRASGLKEGMKDKYYRTVSIDCDILYYDEPETEDAKN